jgi:hypothetical protein
MDELKNFATVLQLASAAAITVAAVYLARFKYGLLDELDKRFIRRPEDREDWPVTRREMGKFEQHFSSEIRRLDEEFGDVWSEMSKREKI